MGEHLPNMHEVLGSILGITSMLERVVQQGALLSTEWCGSFIYLGKLLLLIESEAQKGQAIFPEPHS